jgi:hypothetical protein
MSLKEVVLTSTRSKKTTLTATFYFKVFIEYSQDIYFYKTTFRDESTYITYIFSNSIRNTLFVVKVPNV